MDRNLKHEIVMRRWALLYNRDGAQKLKKAMMRHLYRVKHGDAALETSSQICDEYNPLSYQFDNSLMLVLKLFDVGFEDKYIKYGI